MIKRDDAMMMMMARLRCGGVAHIKERVALVRARNDERPLRNNRGVVAGRRLETPLWTATHKAKVWVVAVSPDGAFVAAGDYANAVRVYAARSGAPVWEKSSWSGKGAPFTWGLAFSGNSAALAIGHWDAYAYVVDVATWTEIAALKRQDRVYSVSRALARGGVCRSYTLVGKAPSPYVPHCYLDRSIDPSINRSIDPSINRSFDRSILRSIDPSIDRSFDRSIIRSILRSIDPSIDRSF